MSDIKTLREASEHLERFSQFRDDVSAEIGPYLAKAIAILCRREIERMEQEASVVSIKEITADALSAAREEGWNAALQAGIDYIKEIVGDVATEKLNAFEVYAALNSLRKGPSND